MDTVNMLNTMRFYCQPILPLVYDESMSYYETLCKVVGQLNTTGETVNKLNEGLTNEIAARQAADAALDERLKTVESTNAKIHFMAFAGTPPYDAKPVTAMPTRSELRQWATDGDMIVTLMQTTDERRNIVYAASCTYNAPNWENASFEDFNIIVPISTSYDATGDYAVRQKIAKITIPPASASSLDVKWGLQFIEVNTPSTSAEGVVNLTASLSDSNEVNCSITPSEFLGLYNMTRGGKNLCVAVNARLEYDAHIRSSSIATVNPDGRTIVITFEQDDGVYTDYGVNQTIRVLHYLIGNAVTNTWEHESIRSRIQDFDRYEGFQFTRKPGNVIATEDDSTPSAVYSYYTQLNGRFYQNLPVHLIDEVDNADYWNGMFDSYSDGHITFTFTTANYATIGEKMVVRVIELSSTKAGSIWTGGEKWSYAAKEFEVPYSPMAVVLDVWQLSDVPTITDGFVTYQGGSNLDFDTILPLVENYQEFVATLHKGTSDKGIAWSSLAYSRMLVNDGVGSITFAALEGVTLANGIRSMNGIVVFSKDSDGNKKVEITFSSALPAPNPDGSDNGKVPTVNGTSWELKVQNRKPLYITIDVANIDERIYTLTDGNKTYTVEEIYAAKENGTPVFIAPAEIGAYFQILDFSFSNNTFKAFFLNVVRRTDVSYGRLIISTIGGQTKGTYNAVGFLAASSSTNNGKFLKMKQDGSGIEYVDGGKVSAVEYTEQTLTDRQKFQARKNIDAAGTDTPQFKGYVTLTPATESEGIGVGLSPITDGNNFALDISDVNEQAPTKLTGVKTPTDTDTNAAATVEYVKNKVKNKVWIVVQAEEVKSIDYADIDNEITNGGGNVWLSIGTEQLRMVVCNKAGASSYELTFVNLSGASFYIHTVTVSASAAEYAVTTK